MLKLEFILTVDAVLPFAGSSGSVAYKVNWLPPRYPFLFSYCVIGLTLLFVCVYLFLRFR